MNQASQRSNVRERTHELYKLGRGNDQLLFSGDGSDQRPAPFARGVKGNCRPPLPVAEAGGMQLPQPRHWRAVVKQAREWHSRQGGFFPLSPFFGV